MLVSTITTNVHTIHVKRTKYSTNDKKSHQIPFSWAIECKQIPRLQENNS